MPCHKLMQEIRDTLAQYTAQADDLFDQLHKMEKNMNLIRSATHQIGSEVAAIRANCLNLSRETICTSPSAVVNALGDGDDGDDT